MSRLPPKLILVHHLPLHRVAYHVVPLHIPLRLALPVIFHCPICLVVILILIFVLCVLLIVGVHVLNHVSFIECCNVIMIIHIGNCSPKEVLVQLCSPLRYPLIGEVLSKNVIEVDGCVVCGDLLYLSLSQFQVEVDVHKILQRLSLSYFT
ncbi:hypothetical protein AMTR_s00031p00108350 [Amborella trichopoda]|uniref:Uncharacterized protein n=1 Tax=Amborella trichopoda TaxID=13333 RepID=U5CTF3_AMBTC|nr:hypothetical protein AMTR_s00031p00108350 [Amborella trichopoda]